MLTAIESAATTRQTWAIFCITGYDVRECGLSKSAASEMIDAAKSNPAEVRETLATLPGAILKKKNTAPASRSHAELYRDAHLAGMNAAKSCEVVPMVVQQHANVMDDRSPVVQQWHVEGGVCGFAWVKVRPATSSFAKWCIANGKGKKDNYAGGLMIWCSEFGQSMQRKEAYCHAFAGVLRAAGINAYSMSRMD